jgi:hypothetical protein
MCRRDRELEERRLERIGRLICRSGHFGGECARYLGCGRSR